MSNGEEVIASRKEGARRSARRSSEGGSGDAPEKPS